MTSNKERPRFAAALVAVAFVGIAPATGLADEGATEQDARTASVELAARESAKAAAEAARAIVEDAEIALDPRLIALSSDEAAVATIAAN